MAGEAIAIPYGLVDNVLLGEIIMTIAASILDGFFEERFEIRGVGRVAVEAVAGFHGLVLEFETAERVIMAGHAEILAGLDQEIFIFR